MEEKVLGSEESSQERRQCHSVLMTEWRLTGNSRKHSSGLKTVPEGLAYPLSSSSTSGLGQSGATRKAGKGHKGHKVFQGCLLLCQRTEVRTPAPTLGNSQLLAVTLGLRSDSLFWPLCAQGHLYVCGHARTKINK